MQAKEYWVIMIHDDGIDPPEDYLAETFASDADDAYHEPTMFDTKKAALNHLAELTATYPRTIYTLYHLVPTEHTTHKR